MPNLRSLAPLCGLLVAGCSADPASGLGPGGKADGTGGIDGAYRLATRDGDAVTGSATLRVEQVGAAGFDFELDARDYATFEQGFVDGNGLPVIDGRAIYAIDADCELQFALAEVEGGVIEVTQTGSCAGFAGPGISFAGRFDRELAPDVAGAFAASDGRTEAALTIRVAAAGRFGFAIALSRSGDAVGAIDGELAPVDGAATVEAGDGCGLAFEFLPGAVDVTQDGYCADHVSSRASFAGFYLTE